MSTSVEKKIGGGLVRERRKK